MRSSIIAALGKIGGEEAKKGLLKALTYIRDVQFISDKDEYSQAKNYLKEIIAAIIVQDDIKTIGKGIAFLRSISEGFLIDYGYDPELRSLVKELMAPLSETISLSAVNREVKRIIDNPNLTEIKRSIPATKREPAEDQRLYYYDGKLVKAVLGWNDSTIYYVSNGKPVKIFYNKSTVTKEGLSEFGDETESFGDYSESSVTKCEIYFKDGQILLGFYISYSIDSARGIPMLEESGSIGYSIDVPQSLLRSLLTDLSKIPKTRF